MTDELIEVNSNTMPGLYQGANQASLDAQASYFLCLRLYLLLLILAALTSFASASTSLGAICAALLFLLTLGILIWMRVKRPDDVWYNGRAVAESVKTRSWRWMMRAEPYFDCEKVEIVSKEFISELKSILELNRSLSDFLPTGAYLKDPISDTMKQVRALPVEQRLSIYKKDRIDDQANFYSTKTIYNKKRARHLFWYSIGLHSLAVILLLFKISSPQTKLPIEVIATTAGAILTWLQAKKHNELASSYSLTAHEIVMIKGEALSISTDRELADFVINAEAAFSREHTQWSARKLT
jgi:hypothetical protein